MQTERHVIDQLFSARRYDDAERLLNQIVASGGADVWVFIKLARVYQKKGDLQKALTASRDALKCDPGSAKAHQILAWSLHFTDDYAGARKEAELALQIDPNDVENYNALAW